VTENEKVNLVDDGVTENGEIEGGVCQLTSAHLHALPSGVSTHLGMGYLQGEAVVRFGKIKKGLRELVLYVEKDVQRRWDDATDASSRMGLRVQSG
jgi:hypothetical protein